MNYIPLDELNEAKKKIMYLMKTKFSDPLTEYVESDDTDADNTFQKVISGVKSSSEVFFQLISFVAKKDGAGDTIYYKNITSHINFQQQVIKLVHLLQSVNQTIDSLNNNFGYVEPHNMTEFKDNMNDFNEIYRRFKKIAILNDKFNITPLNMKETGAAINNLNVYVSKLTDEVDKLQKNETKITSTYNYKSSNVQLKRSAPINFSSNVEPDEDYDDF